MIATTFFCTEKKVLIKEIPDVVAIHFDFLA